MSVRQKIIELLQKIIPEKVEIELGIPEEEKFGHYSTSVAFKLAKTRKAVPFIIAENIKNLVLESAPPGFFEKVEAVKPGFINFWLSPKTLQNQFEEILKNKAVYGRTGLKRPQKIQVEFISANPTGPLTLGNGRGGVFGDVLANVLSFAGHRVTKEYYINDAGVQINSLGRSILEIEPIEYRGQYLDILKRKIKNKNPEVVGRKAAREILKNIKQTVKEMGIKFDVWFSERNLHRWGAAKKLVRWLEKKRLAYQKDGAIWFRSSRFGDEKDRVLVKSDGEPTYFATDFAYHRNKFLERHFEKVINILGADHHGEVARMKAAAEVMGHRNDLEIILMQFVTLVRKGKPARMSKRKGLYITIDDVLKEIGRDVFRFFSLMISADAHLNFDLTLAKEQSVKNPVYYVQYAYVRAFNIIKKAKIKKKTKSDLSFLNTEIDLNLIRKLVQLPEVVEDITKDYQVHRLTRYGIELARAFHNFYEKERIIGAEPDVAAARLTLVRATTLVLENLFKLLGISAPKKM